MHLALYRSQRAPADFAEAARFFSPCSPRETVAETNSSTQASPEASSAGLDARPLGERLQRIAWRHWKQARQRLVNAGKNREHIFLAGMQRSETNMFMDTLEWSDLTDVYHETDPRAFDNYLMRPVSVIQKLADRSRAPFSVIKALCELDRLPDLRDRAILAQAVWIVRNYNDAVNSATRSFGNFVEVVEAVAADRLGAGWRGRRMSDQTHLTVQNLHHPGKGHTITHNSPRCCAGPRVQARNRGCVGGRSRAFSVRENHHAFD
jgi:hypothetical protein